MWIKNRGLRRDFFLNNSINLIKLRCHLAQGSYAAYAQHLMHQAAFFQDGHLLQVGFEGPPGGTLGERTVVSEAGCLALLSITCCQRVMGRNIGLV
ncbi:MAG: hypothetical protein A2Y54_08700 [Chloroflexi bacterium RBG_16_51_16]|nr:MAG: hypothetical protein A2Y54_08700 [Chloroflexi bacterium RBG_16_51_16]